MISFSGANTFGKTILAYARAFNHPFKLRIINELINFFCPSGLKLRSPYNRVLSINSKDFIGHQLLYNGHYEPGSLALAMSLLKTKPNAVFVDIGANMGLYTINAGAISGIKIYAIEPVAKNFLRLQANYRLNNNETNHTMLISLGLADRAHLSYIFNPKENNDGTYRIEETENKDAHLISLITMDELIDHYSIAHVSLLKMDVEGFEGKILAGFKKIEYIKPENILMEYSDYVNRTGINKNDIFDYLINLGYEGLDINGKLYTGEGPLTEDNIWFRLK